MTKDEGIALQVSTLIPLEEYLHTSYHPDCDWIDGKVMERNVGEGKLSNVQGFFIRFLGNHAQQWRIRVWPEQRVQVAATRFRIPGICATRRVAPFEEIIRTPPLLCIEVLSPDDRMSDTQEKVDDYLKMGVEVVWVVDPRRRMAFQTDGRSLQPVAMLTVPGSAITVEVAEVFSELDELEQLISQA